MEQSKEMEIHDQGGSSTTIVEIQQNTEEGLSVPMHAQSNETNDDTLAAFEMTIETKTKIEPETKTQIQIQIAKEESIKSSSSKTNVLPNNDDNNDHDNNINIHAYHQRQQQQHEYDDANDAKSQSESTISTNPSLYNSNMFQISSALQLKSSNNDNRQGNIHQLQHQLQPPKNY